MAEQARYTVTDMAELAPIGCPCGTTRRAFTDAPGSPGSLHVVEIKADSEVHYHKKLTETYYVLEGEGRIELDGESLPIRPGTAVRIMPGCRHRAVGPLKILNVCIPVFDPEDEWED